MKRILLFSVLLLGLTACQQETKEGQAQDTADVTSTTENQETRIVSLNGSLTELLYTLEVEDKLVGVDVTSTYPEAAQALPKLGHIRHLNVEGILNLKPTLVLVDDASAQLPSLEKIKAAGIEVQAVPSGTELTQAADAAEALAARLDITDEKVQALRSTIEADKKALQEVLTGKETQPKVLFIYARGAGNLMIAGQDTPAEAMITHAGGQNAVQGIEGFKALTPEALLKAQPDVVLMFKSGLKSVDGKEGLAKIPGMVETPAYKNDRVLAMDGHYLLGFGPRAAQAAKAVAEYIHQ